MASQCFHKKAMKTTINKVLNVLLRVFIRGTTQLATVETKTRRTAMTASKMLMNFPSRFLAVAFSSPSNCTTCCCCCCSSILEMRVWQASSASCGQEHTLVTPGHSCYLSNQPKPGPPSPHLTLLVHRAPALWGEQRKQCHFPYPRWEADWALQPAIHHGVSSTPTRLDMEMPGWETPLLLPKRGDTQHLVTSALVPGGHSEDKGAVPSQKSSSFYGMCIPWTSTSITFLAVSCAYLTPLQKTRQPHRKLCQQK